MLIYYLIFLVPAIFAFHEPRPLVSINRTRVRHTPKLSVTWQAFCFALVLLVGLRHEVGGDWDNYLRAFDRSAEFSLLERLTRSDPGYQFLEWLAHSLELGIYGVNLLCAILFSVGLTIFCLNLPRPWLAMVVAVPYTVIVLGMGYTRQGVALAFLLLGLVALERERTKSFVVWALIGACFHKSAILVLPMAALAATKSRVGVAAWIAIVSIFAYIVFVQESIDGLAMNYVEQAIQSQGAFVRLLLNAVPAIILLMFLRQFGLTLSQRRLWFWYAIASLVAFIAYFLTAASTALDRMALYLIPLQMVVFSFLPDVLGRGVVARFALVLLVVCAYAAVLIVWLLFANYAHTWIPYQSYLLTDQFWSTFWRAGAGQ